MGGHHPSDPNPERFLNAIVNGVGAPLAVSREALDRDGGRYIAAVWDEPREVWWLVPRMEGQTWDDVLPAPGVERSDGDAGSESTPDTPRDRPSCAPGISPEPGSPQIEMPGGPAPDSPSGSSVRYSSTSEGY